MTRPLPLLGGWPQPSPAVQHSGGQAATRLNAVTGGAARSPAAVRLLVDPYDTVECVRALNGRHRPGDGVVVCHPLPDVDSPTVLAGDVLVALGKRPGCLAAEGVRRRGWEVAGLWLRAERVTDLVVLRAHRLPASRWRELAELTASVGAVLWLVSHRMGLDGAHQAVLGTCGVDPAGQPWRDALGALPPVSTEPDPGPFPAVPDVDFVAFRSAARRLLDPDGFSRVDAVYRAAFQVAVEEARVLRVQARCAEVDCWRGVEAAVQRVTVDAGSEAEVLARVRAAQAGFFREGTLLRVRLHRAGGQPGFSLRPRLPATVLARLRTLCAPAAAGALAIRAATGLDAAALGELRTGDVLDRGRHVEVTWSGGRWLIPAGAAAAVRAAVADHRGGGASGAGPAPDRPLFDRDGAAMPVLAMARLLTAASARAGLSAAEPVATGIHTADLRTVHGS
jgi:hypothetical protein